VSHRSFLLSTFFHFSPEVFVPGTSRAVQTHFVPSWYKEKWFYYYTTRCIIIKVTLLLFIVKTVFATGSPMMRTFDGKKLNKRPPPFFLYSFEKPRETCMCGPCGAHTFCGVSREIFFFDFKDMSRKGAITISGGKNRCRSKILRKVSKNSLIPKL
jgi:hypothetical protein